MKEKSITTSKINNAPSAIIITSELIVAHPPTLRQVKNDPLT